MYTNEDQKKMRKEMRIFNATDFCWAAIIGILAAFVGVKLMLFFGVFEGALINGWLGEMDFRGSAEKLSYLGIFVVSGILTLMHRAKNR